MKKILIAAAAVALSSAPAFAANNTASASGSATAVIVTPITLTHTSTAALNFGTFAAAAGTIQVNADGTNVYSGPVPMGNSVTAADAFTVAGQGGAAYSISTGGGKITLTTGSTTINFTTVPSVTSATLSGTGTGGFTVGGTLTLLGTEGAGTYTGSYTATVTYE